MKLSIIIPMYNVEIYIVQCLQSLLNQDISKEDYELIAIDDGSTDNSYDLAKTIADLNSNINIYKQKNHGLSATRNRGIKLAKGDSIYFVDSDDYIASNTLNKLITIVFKYDLEILEFKYKKTKSRKLLISDTKYISTNNLKILDGKKYISARNFKDSVWTYLVNRKFLINSKVKFIEGKVMEDMIYTLELISKAKRIAFYPLDVYRYVINPNSIWTTTEPKAYRKSIDDFIFMTVKYNQFILKLENQNIDTNILKFKKQMMLFNIAKRMLRSDFNFSEINQIIKNLISHNLYPLRIYKGKNHYRKSLTFLFNYKYLFFITIWFYRIFRVPFENIIIKNYQKRRQNL